MWLNALVVKEKAFDKMQLPFTTNNLSKLGRERNIYNLTKVICIKPSVCTILNGEKPKCFSLRLNLRQRELPSPFLFIIIVQVGPRQCNKVRKLSKMPTDWKWRNKTVFLQTYLSTYKILKFIRKILEWTNS